MYKNEKYQLCSALHVWGLTTGPGAEKGLRPNEATTSRDHPAARKTEHCYAEGGKPGVGEVSKSNTGHIFLRKYFSFDYFPGKSWKRIVEGADRKRPLCKLKPGTLLVSAQVPVREFIPTVTGAASLV